MAPSTLRKIGASLMLTLLLQLSPTTARGASIANISVTNSRDHLLLYLRVKDAFTRPVHKAVSSGVATTFSFRVILEEVRQFWANRTLTEMTLTHTIKYNNLKKEFTVQRSWEAETPLPLRTADEAQERMSRIDGLRVIRLDRLEKGRRYRIRAKARLSEMTLPFYLRYIRVMASMWEFETDWHTVDFVY
jgi:hypothetical protein